MIGDRDGVGHLSRRVSFRESGPDNDLTPKSLTITSSSPASQ